MIQRRIISVSLTKAATLMGVGRSTVYRWLAQDLIAAVREPGGWKIFLLQITSEDEVSYFTFPHSALPQLVGEQHHKLLTQEG